MEIGNIIKSIMSRKKITQLVFSEMTGKKANGLSRDLQSTPKPVADRVRMLELLGYEVIVRERRPGRRAEGEYVVTIEGDEPEAVGERRESRRGRGRGERGDRGRPAC